MEDRKRPAIADTDEYAPPSKRQAVNGGGSRAKDDNNGDYKDEAWLEDFQKDALIRQMNEYKREKATLETRIEEIQKRSTYHDDHIRIADAWVLQLLQEIELLCEGTVSSHPESKEHPYPSALSFKDSRDFQKHLGEKTKAVKTRMELLLSRLAGMREAVKPEVTQLETQIKTLLAAQKEYALQLDRLETDKEDISQQLDTATLRYIKAEKRIDRMRSLQVQKMEEKALAHVTPRPAAENGGDASAASSADLQALQGKYDENLAAFAKQKEQLDRLFAELKAAQDENSAFRAKRESVSEEDYARTDLFKQLKSKSEDLIRRANHLEATNKQLREEIEKLQTDRTAFRTKLELEAQAVTSELEDQIQAKEQDLTRIRSARDELVADVQIRKASQDQERTAFEHMKELVTAKDDRITALELELDRLRPSEDGSDTATTAELEALSPEQLRERLLKLEKDYALIQAEMPSVEKAYKRAISLAQKKVMDFTALEERVTILTLEKAKADQKYFAARKDMDIRNAEIRALRHQNSKSSEIITSLKEVEAQSRSLLSNLEKQLADFRQSNTTVADESRILKSANADITRRFDSSKGQIMELTNLVKARDVANISLREQAAAHETELEKLKVRIGHLQKDRDNWKTKCLANSSEEEEMLRKFALCSVCRNDFKNAIIKTCGHVFCQSCIDARLSNRMRKCPTCNKAFDKMDVMTAHL
ncbi:histone ubiquitinationc protein [Grosmannia clavigera kw1407]|uniref:E3 ubiquitin protein ligase n=1 Tax=Grosmannia clavigera (strain kw1407 / UAMH 11150) TaxID=655863 RepID=F0XST9_GROCL|nr:histone ubiquitinationc protein [Grosmannia clavigera kw1407]EFW99342.1 histone ubiquitinationc protein [Grosmannia clavigera kw1407]